MQEGLDGLLVLGRGGGTLDRHGNLMYLTQYYTSFPTIADVSGEWASRGYGAALLTPNAEVILAIDVVGIELDDVVATDVHCSEDVIGAVIERIRSQWPRRCRIGLVGWDVLTALQWIRLHDALPGVQFVQAEATVEDLRLVKSASEQSVLRKSASVGLRAIRAMTEAVEVGRTEAEIAGVGAKAIVEEGLAIANIFVATYGSTRPRRVRMLPTYLASDPFKPGEVVCIDITGALHGYYFDISRSQSVGKESAEQLELRAVAEDAVATVIRNLRPGNTVRNATLAGLEVLRRAPSEAERRSFRALGHGLGLGIERPWLMPSDGTEILPGMCLAVEKKIAVQGNGVWVEEDVIVHLRGPEIITRPFDDRVSPPVAPNIPDAVKR